MLCSAAELELSEDHDGIIELPDDAPVGVPYARFAGLDDPVIDVAVTPNRPDATGVAGIARDLAAAGLGSVKTATPKPSAGAFDCPTGVHLDFAPADKHLCPAFALRLVRGVTNGPSPEWMQKRLRAIGLRPISALVDITNYITFDRGRPLHVFDFAKVAGDLRSAARARAKACSPSTERPIHSTKPWWRSLMRTALSRSPGSWVANIPAATRRRATC